MNILNQRYFMIFYFIRCKKDILGGCLRLLLLHEILEWLEQLEPGKKKVHFNIFQSKIENITFYDGRYRYKRKVILNRCSLTFNHVKKISGIVVPTPLILTAALKHRWNSRQNRACFDNLM